MKKFIKSIKFISKVIFLVIILIFGWIFINVGNIIKLKKPHGDNKLKSMIGPDEVQADAPSNCNNCPQIAIYDGNKFSIENDFLCGRPEYIFADLAGNNVIPGSTLSRPDILKFRRPLARKDGKLLLQLQENEPEESFVAWLKLIRVVHPKGSDIVIDSNFDKFYVFNKKISEKNIILSQSIYVNGKESVSMFSDRNILWNEPGEEDGVFLKNGDSIEFLFSGLQRDKAPVLIVKSTFRNWVMGLSPAKTEPSHAFSFVRRLAPRLLLIIFAAGYTAFWKHGLAGVFSMAPFIIGSGGSCPCTCKSIVFSYRDSDGAWRRISINKPRAWQYSAEAVVFPKESIMEDGALRVRAEFTKPHKLGFVGIIQDLPKVNYLKEEVPIVRAVHSRVGDVTSMILPKKKGYAHLIPGDKIDIEFSDPEIKKSKNDEETYLMQSFGFYTSLSGRNQKLAGNWQEKISDDAKKQLDAMVQLKDFS